MSAFRKPLIICFAGSQKQGSWNRKLLDLSAKKLKALGAEVDVVDSEKLNFPLYSEDVEKAGLPQGLQELKKRFKEADGICIASPEYNGFVTPFTVNTFSWLSRKIGESDSMYAAFEGKPTLLMTASPGGLGGMRSLNPMQEYMVNMGSMVLPKRVAIGSAFKAFTDNGDLNTDRHVEMLNDALQLLHVAARNDANQEHVCFLAKRLASYGEVIIPN